MRLSGRALVLVAAAATAAFALTAMSAGARQDNRIFIGMSLHFTGPDTTAGTFVMSGKLEDSGASEVDNLRLEPIGGTDTARLSGNQTYIGSKGTISTRFEGKAFPLSSPHQVGRGRITFLSGTGAYAGIRGHAGFLIVVDVTSNQLIGTAAGNVRIRD
jgi:hypothetical protein